MRYICERATEAMQGVYLFDSLRMIQYINHHTSSHTQSPMHEKPFLLNEP